MFELEELYDLLQEGAFQSQEEFLSFADGLSHEQLFELMQEGAFADLEEFKKTVNLKKKNSKRSFGWRFSGGYYGFYYTGRRSIIFTGIITKPRS
jgi:hypothetical protein